MINCVFVATTDDAFGLIPDCISAVRTYIGDRYVRKASSYDLLVDTELTKEDKAQVYSICQRGKIEIFFISLPDDFQGNIRDLKPDENGFQQ